MAQVTYQRWESVIKGTSCVYVTDDRGHDRERFVGGPRNPPNIMIKTSDVEYNKELNPENNPFTNGSLRRIDGDYRNRIQDGKTDEQLLGRLQTADDIDSHLDSIPEMEVRRLLAMAEDPDSANRLTMSQFHAVRGAIARRWPPLPVPELQTELGDVIH